MNPIAEAFIIPGIVVPPNSFKANLEFALRVEVGLAGVRAGLVKKTARSGNF